MTWAVITGEYPPQPGGVSDYTQLVAAGLAREGGDVHVWAPPAPAAAAPLAPNVRVHRLSGHFSLADLRLLDAGLDRLPQPRRILVQYVPHAFAWKAMNVPFCLWLQSRRRDSIWSMFHEVAFPLEWNRPLKHHALGVVTGAMARLVARASEHIFFSTTAWLPMLDRYARSTHKTWLPVPSNLPEIADPRAVEAVRARWQAGHGSSVAGHFGTYAPQNRALLAEIFTRVLAGDSRRIAVFAGRGSDAFRASLAAQNPDLENRMQAVETTCAGTLSCHLAACDVLVQPYPDGVTTRRGTLMAGLALGKPVVTVAGRLTEPIWAESKAVVLAPGNSQAIVSAVNSLLADSAARRNLGERAAALYADRFALRHTVRTLLAQS